MALTERHQDLLRNVITSALTAAFVVIGAVWSGGVQAGHLDTRLANLENSVLYHHQTQEPEQERRAQADHDALIQLTSKVDLLMKQIDALQKTNDELLALIRQQHAARNKTGG